jgi:hypothetical protein
MPALPPDTPVAAIELWPELGGGGSGCAVTWLTGADCAVLPVYSAVGPLLCDA